MFAYSTDGESYSGSFETAAEALSEASAGREDGYILYVGRCVDPARPEDLWNAEDWLEHVSVQDDYSCDWADDWDRSTKGQRSELEVSVRKVMSDWLDAHGLRPRFYNVFDVVEYVMVDGFAWARSERES